MSGRGTAQQSSHSKPRAHCQKSGQVWAGGSPGTELRTPKPLLRAPATGVSPHPIPVQGVLQTHPGESFAGNGNAAFSELVGKGALKTLVRNKIETKQFHCLVCLFLFFCFSFLGLHIESQNYLDGRDLTARLVPNPCYDHLRIQ